MNSPIATLFAVIVLIGGIVVGVKSLMPEARRKPDYIPRVSFIKTLSALLLFIVIPMAVILPKFYVWGILAAIPLLIIGFTMQTVEKFILNKRKKEAYARNYEIHKSAFENVRLNHEPLLNPDEAYSIFDKDLVLPKGTISGTLLQELIRYTLTWDEDEFNYHDIYIIGGIGRHLAEEGYSVELVSFIENLFPQDDDITLRWVYSLNQ